MKPKLTIGWLYPELMSTYGDRGNILVMTERARWRGIEVEVKLLNPGYSPSDLKKCNFLLMGGAQDQEQKIVNDDLKKNKNVLSEMIEIGTPGIYVCGGFQFLGHYYKEADGTQIPGLGIFDLYTIHLGFDKERLIGNLAVDTDLPLINKTLIGFENHGGRTYIGEKVNPLGKVLKGYGNNGDDGTEGAIYKNSIGTYMHGPILPKNSGLADYLIEKALGKKYKNPTLMELDDSIEKKAHDAIAKTLGIEI